MGALPTACYALGGGAIEVVGDELALPAESLGGAGQAEGVMDVLTAAAVGEVKELNYRRGVIPRSGSVSTTQG